MRKYRVHVHDQNDQGRWLAQADFTGSAPSRDSIAEAIPELAEPGRYEVRINRVEGENEYRLRSWLQGDLAVVRRDEEVGMGEGWLVRYGKEHFVISTGADGATQAFRSSAAGVISDWDDVASGDGKLLTLRELAKRPRQDGRVLSRMDTLDQAEDAAASPYVKDPENPTDAELAAAIQRGLEDGSLIDAQEWVNRQRQQAGRTAYIVKRESGYTAGWFTQAQVDEGHVRQFIADCNANVPGDPAHLEIIPDWPEDGPLGVPRETGGYAPNTPEYRAWRQAQDNGKAAAGWVFDGNTPPETYRYFLNGIRTGDPAVLDSVRTPDLSGEMGDEYSEELLMRDVGWVPSDGTDLRDELAEQYNREVSTAFWDEVERLAAKHSCTCQVPPSERRGGDQDAMIMDRDCPVHGACKECGCFHG